MIFIYNQLFFNFIYQFYFIYFIFFIYFTYFVNSILYRIQNLLLGLRAGHSLQLCFLSSLDLLLSTLERGISYFNRYAFCYIAIYGHDFMSASR